MCGTCVEDDEVDAVNDLAKTTSQYIFRLFIVANAN